MVTIETIVVFFRDTKTVLIALQCFSKIQHVFKYWGRGQGAIPLIVAKLDFYKSKKQS